MFRYVLAVATLCFALSPVLRSQQTSQTTTPAGADESSETVTITDRENGKEIALPEGAKLVVQLMGNPTTGYSWVVAGDPSPLYLLKTTRSKANPSKPALGAPRTQELKFAAASTGVSSLTLEYRRPWERDVTAAKTLSVKVEVR